MKADGILFDLDGTLWDATESITAVWNALRRQACPDALASFTQAEIRSCMGMRLDDIGRKLFPDEAPERQQSLVDRFCSEEVKLLSRTGGRLYPGLQQTLRALHERFPLFIVSNCQSGYIECFLHAHHRAPWFRDIECAGRTGLPKAQNIALVARRNGLKAPVYVGDTALDGRSAHEAGVPFIFARYGFGATQDFEAAIDSLGELPALLEG